MTILSHAAMQETPQVTIEADARVLHVVTGMGRGGAEKVAAQLSSVRGENGGIAWLKGANAWSDELTGEGTWLRPLEMSGIKDLPRTVGRLARLLREYRPDVVHTHLTHAHIVGRWAAKLAGRMAVVSTEHNLRVHDSLPLRLLARLDRHTSRDARAVVAISEAVRKRCVIEGFYPGSLQVVYNGVDVPDRLPETQIRDRPRIAMVGRLKAVKGPDLFVRALGALPGVRGVLLGDGEMAPEIAGLREGLDDPSRLDWLREGVAMSVLADADVVVVPSRQEGLGLVALEAMSLERPVVAARVGGLEEVIVQDVTGALVDPERPEAIAKAVSNLLNDPSARVSMGRAGRSRVKERFSLSRMISEYERIYRSICR